MNDIILRYLNKQYMFTSTTYTDNLLYDRINNIIVSINQAFVDIYKIFGLNNDEIVKIFDMWVDQKAIIFNNKVIDYKYNHYEHTGVMLTQSETDKYISEMMY